MKKLGLVLIVLLLSSMLFANGAGEAETVNADGERTYKVGFSNVWVGNTYGVQCVNELEVFLKNT